jgi:Ala-tRNA(Pro) deacylase
MLDRRTRHLLDRFDVTYATVPHGARTGDLAHCHGGNRGGGADRPAGRCLPASVLLARVDGRPTLVLVPHGATVDVERLGCEADAVAAHLAPVREFRDLFPNCVPGGMPPLGQLVGVDVFADHAFTHADQILLPIGQPDHDHLAVCWSDFVRLTNPLMGRFVADGVFAS